MKLTSKLDDINAAVKLCTRCGMCTTSNWPDNAPMCPLYLNDKCFTYSPGGFVYIVRSIVEGRVSNNMNMAELAYACLMCGSCDGLCQITPFPPPHAQLSDIIRLLRADCVRKGLLPARTKTLYEKMRKAGDYLTSSDIDLNNSAELLDDNSDTVLFAECFHNDGTQKQIYQSAFNLLKKCGTRVSLFNDGGCCGSTLYDLGFWDILSKLIPEKWKRMRDAHDKTFLFINPHCQEFVLKRYPEIIDGFEGIEGKHFSEFLADSLEKGTLKSKNTGAVKVTYHDPCYLGRGLDIYEAPRKVLSYLDGVELTEMKNNRANSLCCGSRATEDYFQGLAINTAGKTLQAFRNIGADLLITACPECKSIFQDTLPAKDKGKIKDLIEFVDERTMLA